MILIKGKFMYKKSNIKYKIYSEYEDLITMRVYKLKICYKECCFFGFIWSSSYLLLDESTYYLDIIKPDTEVKFLKKWVDKGKIELHKIAQEAIKKDINRYLYKEEYNFKTKKMLS